LRRYYALFFIAHASRRVWLAGRTANPTGTWVTQQARNLGIDLRPGRPLPDPRRDRKYSAPFDEIFRSEGMRIVKTPVQAPKANGADRQLHARLGRDGDGRHHEKQLTGYIAAASKTYDSTTAAVVAPRRSRASSGPGRDDSHEQ
jgi:hypothetical protein